MEEMLRVGVICSTHGVKGEVKVYPTTDDPERFRQLKEVIVDTKKEQFTLIIQQVRFFKNMVILKFKEYDTINAVEKYKACDLLIHRSQAVPLNPGEYFIADLIGLAVFTDEGKKLGQLKDVMQTGANDVYVIQQPNGKELLIPAIKDCIKNIDISGGKMVVHLLPGLRDE